MTTTYARKTACLLVLISALDVTIDSVIAFSIAFSSPAFIISSSSRANRVTNAATAATRLSLYIERGREDEHHFHRSNKKSNKKSHSSSSDSNTGSGNNEKIDKRQNDFEMNPQEAGPSDNIIYYNDLDDLLSGSDDHDDSSSISNSMQSSLPSKPADSSSVEFLVESVNKMSASSAKQPTVAPSHEETKKKTTPKRKTFGTTAFSSTNYLDSLSSSNAGPSSSTTKHDDDDTIKNSADVTSTSNDDFNLSNSNKKNEEDEVLKNLKDHQSIHKNQKETKIIQANRDAMRRSNEYLNEVAQARLLKVIEESEKKESDALEKMYADRRERLEKKRYLEEEQMKNEDKVKEDHDEGTKKKEEVVMYKSNDKATEEDEDAKEKQEILAKIKSKIRDDVDKKLKSLSKSNNLNAAGSSSPLLTFNREQLTTTLQYSNSTVFNVTSTYA